MESQIFSEVVLGVKSLRTTTVEDLGSGLTAVACTGSDNKLENLLCGWDVFIAAAVAMTTLNPSKVELK